MKIRASIVSDRLEISRIHIEAFGEEKGPEIVGLVNDLFNDRTAEPLISLVAVENEKIIGHILFIRSGLSLNRCSGRAVALAQTRVLLRS